ncbi:hypothetical protein DB345_02545 [Spartobacteria bacterium LR76]|nr:hypothetical protein DB345_02545 [Spartobacteria bacterium LR76]
MAFGPLSSVDVGFCAGTLESLALSRLRRLKDLSALPALPRLEHLELSHLHGFVPPDFRLFPHLRYLHGMRDVFRSAAAREYMRLRPEVRVDQGIPADLGKHPEIKEYFAALRRDKGN